ncbi:MAG: arylesterase [Gammaproteobacteria bacterium]|nr:arylesterase [Gammaproteobacteria bacterium]
MIIRFFLSVTLFAMSTATFAALPPVILVYGDSLSAGFGIEQNAGWVSLLQQRLREKGYGHQVVNASISGETTSGGLARFNNTLDQFKPKIVLIELGANDGLRGLPIDAMHDNLAKMIEISQKRGTKILLIAMKLPPNYGTTYTESFANTFYDLTKHYKLPKAPFLLNGLSTPDHFQADGLHPTAQAQSIILDNIWPSLKPLLK